MTTKAMFLAKKGPIAALLLACTTPLAAQGNIVPGGSSPSGAGTGTVQSAPLAPLPGFAPPAIAPPNVTPPAEATAPTTASPALTPPTIAPVLAPPVVAPAQPKPADNSVVVPPATAPVTSAPPPASVAPPAAASAVDADLTGPNSTLAGKPGDTVNVDDLMLLPKDAAVATGKSTWDDGPKTLADTFARMRAEAEKAGVKVAGRPVAIFVETDDAGFRFEAILPIDRIPANRDLAGPDIRFSQTPNGRALRFVHKGPYDDVDSTYEVITAYLDAKGIIVRDAFIEEYVGELKDSSESGFEVNIYVQPR